ncbi:glycosyltransferase family 2 protein [Microbacterium mangrovi]|uniref:glycosyltransferase family 2 protein n=1 Tax=Microbacterium mangrovi TaxID=1348253 RepID=UPI00068D3EFB|nr:glycosyltransferase family 2 protein [Microbacterium mangrovi]
MTSHETRPAVSVVVPVYNPGPFLRPLLDALDAQSPVDDGHDAILVDDGSTDGTGTALDRWCAERPWARVIHQPNSGWPSRPRNVGTDASGSEFILFVDADDRITPTALADLVRFGREAGSDVVVGRMRGVGRKVPVVLFRRTVRDARAPQVPLPDSMTSHAMFRRAFLTETGLRFDESARRVEDHLFVSAAYTSAHRVSVYADSDVYVHVARSDGAGAGFSTYDPETYYHDLARAITIVMDAREPGPERDAYLSRWVRIELVGRLHSDAVRWMPAGRRDAFFAAVRDTLTNAMPADIVARVPAAWRWPTALAVVATPAEFLRAEDAMRLTVAADLEGVPGSTALAGLVSPESLERAVALLGADEPLPNGRAARTPRVARIRRLQHAALRVTAVSGRLHRQLADWGRTPVLFARQTGAAVAPILAVAAFVCALTGAPGAATLLVAGAGAITIALAVRSTGGGGTAVRQLLVLATCTPRAASVREWVAIAASAVLVGAGHVADGLSRRRSVRAHAGAIVWRHPGTITLRAAAITVLCAVVAALVL